MQFQIESIDSFTLYAETPDDLKVMERFELMIEKAWLRGEFRIGIEERPQDANNPAKLTCLIPALHPEVSRWAAEDVKSSQLPAFS